MRAWVCAVMAAAVFCLSGCGYNRMMQQDEGVKAAWSEVVNQYQRRADLIPNLVNTVKGYAAQEQKVLIGVTEARAKVGSIQVTPELLNDPAAVRQIPGRAGRAHRRPEEPVRGHRELSAAEVGPELPRPAGAARGHGEPHHRGAQPLHPGGAGLQRHAALLPQQPHGDDVRLPGEAELHASRTSSRSRPRRRSTSAPPRRLPPRRRRPRTSPRPNDRTAEPRPPPGGPRAAVAAGGGRGDAGADGCGAGRCSRSRSSARASPT